MTTKRAAKGRARGPSGEERAPRTPARREAQGKATANKKAAKPAAAKNVAKNVKDRAERRLTSSPPRALAKKAPAREGKVARARDGKVAQARGGKAKSAGAAASPKVAHHDGGPSALPRSEELLPTVMGRVMELHWGDEPAPPRAERLVERWVKRGDALLRHLAEHGAARHEYRADLKEGRFVWVAPDGQVSAEAKALVLCSYVRSTSVLSMAWVDPMTRGAAIPRLDGMPKERDDLDEEGAWRVAMHAAELSGADYLYRVTTPHAYYFLALNDLSFAPRRRSFTPSTPVGLVLRALGEVRRSIESRAEPTEIVRARLSDVGRALLHEAEYVYRDTDWVARLERAGRTLVQLAERLPRGSYSSVAAGRSVDEWLDREETLALLEALSLLEDEWTLFA
ncbi:MAG: hypothetical protein U0359_08405 [Byssovorax sp.]